MLEAHEPSPAPSMSEWLLPRIAKYDPLMGLFDRSSSHVSLRDHADQEGRPVTEPRAIDGEGPPPATSGAIGVASSQTFPTTLAPKPPSTAERDPADLDAAQEEPAQRAAGQWAAPAPDRTINVSDSDTDVSLVSNSAQTQSAHALDARTAAANYPISPGVHRRRRLQPQKPIVFAIAGGLGVVALALTVRAFGHRTSVSAPSASSLVSGTAVPVASAPPSPPDVPSAAVAVAPGADSATSPPIADPPAPPASAKHATPRKRPVGTKARPPKTTR